jgi:hypothetical protein
MVPNYPRRCSMWFRSGLWVGQSLINAILFTLQKISVSLAVWLALWHYHVEKEWYWHRLKHTCMPHKNLILVAFGIQIPFDNDEINATAVCSACPDQDRSPTPKTTLFMQVRSSRQNFHFSLLGRSATPWCLKTMPKMSNSTSRTSNIHINDIHRHTSIKHANGTLCKFYGILSI